MGKKQRAKQDKVKQEKLAEDRFKRLRVEIKKHHLNVNDVKMRRLMRELLNSHIQPKVIAFYLKPGLDPKIIYDLRKVVLAN